MGILDTIRKYLSKNKLKTAFANVRADWVDDSLYDCWQSRFACVVELKQYKKAEKAALKTIRILETRKMEHWRLKKWYGKIIEFYKNCLEDDEKANIFDCKLKKLERSVKIV